MRAAFALNNSYRLTSHVALPGVVLPKAMERRMRLCRMSWKLLRFLKRTINAFGLWPAVKPD